MRRKDLELRLQRSQAEWEVRPESPRCQVIVSLTRKLLLILLVTPLMLPINQSSSEASWSESMNLSSTHTMAEKLLLPMWSQGSQRTLEDLRWEVDTLRSKLMEVTESSKQRVQVRSMVDE